MSSTYLQIAWEKIYVHAYGEREKLTLNLHDRYKGYSHKSFSLQLFHNKKI